MDRHCKKSQTSRFKGQKGFSLIELMIVISIFGILATAAFGAIVTGIPRARLNAAARDMMADMRNARQLAAKDNWQYAMIVTGQQTYQIVRADTPLLVQTANPYIVITNRNNITEGRPEIQWNIPALMAVFESNGTITSWNGAGLTNTLAPNNIVLTKIDATSGLPDPFMQTRTVSAAAFGRIQVQIP